MLPTLMRARLRWDQPHDSRAETLTGVNVGLESIKWEAGVGFRPGEFSVTLAGNVSVGMTQVAAKGPDVAHESIAGPRCHRGPFHN